MKGLEILLPSRRGGSGTDISLKNGGVRPRRPCPLNLGLGPSLDLGTNIQMLPAGTTVKKTSNSCVKMMCSRWVEWSAGP